MNDSAVVTGLVGGKVSFLLEQHQTGAGPASQDFTSSRQSDNTAAHHAKVITHELASRPAMLS